MAVKSTTLFSLSILKSHLGIETSNSGKDADLSRLADGISERVEAHTQRVFVSRAVTEVRDGNGRELIDLRHYPITGVTSVKTREGLDQAWTALASSEYTFDAQLGILYLIGLVFPPGPLSTEVVYTAGFGAQDSPQVPADIYQAALDYAKLVYTRWQTNSLMASSVNVGTQSITVIQDLPRDLRNVFDSYVKRRIGRIR